VAGHLGTGLGTVSGVERRARAAGLDWAQVEALSDEALEARLYGPPRPPTHHRPVPDCAHLHAERHKPGVTLELLHLEYLEHHPDGYRYTQFCEVYRQWLHRRGRSMRQVHHAGDKCFVDYAGQKPRLIDAATGAVIEVELFVAVLDASNYTYAEATAPSRSPIGSRAISAPFSSLAGSPPPSSVTSSRAASPWRAATSRDCNGPTKSSRSDKPKIEVAVQIVERWILARLRHETFFSLAVLATFGL
jgi:transposase